MSDKIPGWLQQQNDALSAIATAKAEQELTDLTIETRGREFWGELLAEFKLVAEHPPAGLWARFQHSNFAVSRHEDHCRIEAGYLGTCPRMNYTDLWYSPGDKKIRCKTTLVGAEFPLLLCVVDGRIRIITHTHHEPMSIEDTVRFIVEPMNDYAIKGALTRT
jgi:hypothetical protein